MTFWSFYGHLVNWVQGNAENLPFEDNQFDVYTVAFGIRNCTHVDKVSGDTNGTSLVGA